jgi:hypothetical protein
MADNEFVREWTAEEAAEKGVHGASVAPRVSNTSGAASGADHRSGIAPAADENNPAYPPRRPAGNAGNTGVTP